MASSLAMRVELFEALLLGTALDKRYLLHLIPNVELRRLLAIPYLSVRFYGLDKIDGWFVLKRGKVPGFYSSMRCCNIWIRAFGEFFIAFICIRFSMICNRLSISLATRSSRDGT